MAGPMFSDVPMTIRITTPDDDSRILDIYNRINHDRPPMSVDEYRHWMARLPVGAGLERYVAEAEGVVVGSTDMREADWMARADTYVVFLEVDAGYTGRRIGSRLYDTLMQRASALGAERLYGVVREDMPESLHFVERRGCRRTGRVHRMSRLDVQGTHDLDVYSIEIRLEGEGIRLVNLEELGTGNEGFMRSLQRLEHEVEGDIPSSEAVGPLDPYDRWLQETLHGPGKSPQWFWIALAGSVPVGLTRLRMRGERTALNGLTGVARSYRGRGIARALKLRSTAWARQHGIDYIVTGNDMENHPMLAVNAALGYRPLAAEIEVVKELRIEPPPA